MRMIIWHHKNAARTILKMWFEYSASFSTTSLKDDARMGGSIYSATKRVYSATKKVYSEGLLPRTVYWILLAERICSPRRNFQLPRRSALCDGAWWRRQEGSTVFGKHLSASLWCIWVCRSKVRWASCLACGLRSNAGRGTCKTGSAVATARCWLGS